MPPCRIWSSVKLRRACRAAAAPSAVRLHAWRQPTGHRCFKPARMIPLPAACLKAVFLASQSNQLKITSTNVCELGQHRPSTEQQHGAWSLPRSCM